MAYLAQLGMIGMVAVVGIGAGVQLGQSAIAEINPVYFREAETRFYADLTPAGYSPGTAYVPRQGMAGQLDLGTGCVGCRTYPEEYYPAHEASGAEYEEEWAVDEAVPALAEPPAEAPEEVARRAGELARVERYASAWTVEAPVVETVSAEEEETAPVAGEQDAPAVAAVQN